MKATLGSLPPDDDAWAYEFKWDGYRTIVFAEAGRVRVQSSAGHDVTASYPQLATLAGAVAADRAVLDGELVVLDDQGRPRFELMQRHAERAVFFPFDVLSLGDHDTISLPYTHRRRLLVAAVESGPWWRVHEHQVGGGADLLADSRRLGLEGVMAKRLTSTYQPGRRTPSWRKVKNRHQTDVVVGGFTEGTGRRAGTFGALLVGMREPDGRLRFAGGVGSGFTDRRLGELRALLDGLRQDACPFDPLPPRPYRVHATWVRPELTVTVAITEWTNDGLVRQAAYCDPPERDSRYVFDLG
jgi:bifunctional non-homologous end joining protein LigD